MVLRSASLQVCIFYLFLGKYMESKTYVSTRMVVQSACTLLVDQLQIKYGKISSENVKTVNFLDVTFDLCTGRQQPYKKLKDTPTYINVNSIHPPNIIKALPDNVIKRISNISSDKATFNNAAHFYNDVLSASGYKENLTYQQDLPPFEKIRQRKIIWFNLPYSVNV